ncbi:MAG: hypothetical protein IJI35_15330 [Kiritimatiellae bacterium]|nr:hypothetical protein [Kiritimatiellia bacterium]
MAQDDMHVIIYKVLAYLYDCMKKGIDPDKSMLAPDGLLFGGVPERYWNSIWLQMLDKGLVVGVAQAAYDDSTHIIILSPEVTLDGVEFMQENSMMKKAKDFLKDMKSILPFV